METKSSITGLRNLVDAMNRRALDTLTYVSSFIVDSNKALNKMTKNLEEIRAILYCDDGATYAVTNDTTFGPRLIQADANNQLVIYSYSAGFILKIRNGNIAKAIETHNAKAEKDPRTKLIIAWVELP